LVTACAVSLGLLISSITRTVAESVELAMYVFFIVVLSTGIFMPINSANKYFPYFMKIIPFYYAVEASRKVNMAGVGFSYIANDIYILLAALALFLVLAVGLLRRQLK
jgi:ABC-2 type transport system permease protein